MKEKAMQNAPKAEKDDGYFLMPEEYPRKQLNDLYREIPLKATVSRLLRKYLIAMAHLYGIIPLKKVYEIITSQNPGLLTKKAFSSFARIARHEREDYVILKQSEIYLDGKAGTPFDWMLIDINMLDDEDDAWGKYHRVVERQEDKPYYIPMKEEMLCYQDRLYLEDTPEAIAFFDFLRQHLPKEKASYALQLALLEARSENKNPPNLFEMMEIVGLELQTDEELDMLLKLHMDFRNATRKPGNRGFSPKELVQMYPESCHSPIISLGSNVRKAIASGLIDMEQLRQKIMEMEWPHQELRDNLLKEIAKAEEEAKQQVQKPFIALSKVDGNAPCPCGSGKKYKYCCGQYKM